MSKIVDSVRKNQRMIILVAALGVLAFYVIPFDQIGNAFPGEQGLTNAISNVQATHDKIGANENIPTDVQYRIQGHLDDVISHLSDVKYKLEQRFS